MEQLFYIFFTTLPCHIIPFTLFWNFQWRSRKAALTLVTLNILCKMASASYCLSNGLYFRNLELLFAVSGFLIYCCFLCLNPFKMLFTYLLIVDYLLIIRGIASVLAIQVFDIPIQGWGSGFICILLYGVTLPPLLRFFRQVVDQVYRTNAPRLWKMIWLVPAFVTVLALIFTDSYLESSVDSGFFLFCRIGLLICAFAIYYVLLHSLESLEQQAALRQRLIFESRLLENIAFTARLTIPAQTENLDDRALCVVFANLLENAVEACGRMTGGEKFIRLNSSLEYGVLTITMDNSFNGTFAKQEENFLSSKRNEVGIGLSSIQAVVKAHQGDARFEADGTVFRSSAYCRW